MSTNRYGHRPLTEYDCMTWLYGRMSEHDVLAEVEPGCYQLDGAPAFRTEGLSYGDASLDTLCEVHSNERARSLGYAGPTVVRTAYQPGQPFEVEEAMLLRDEAGSVVSVATYSMGRADFEPGEPRTDPCAECGTETLRCGISCPEHFLGAA